MGNDAHAGCIIPEETTGDKFPLFSRFLLDVLNIKIPLKDNKTGFRYDYFITMKR